MPDSENEVKDEKAEKAKKAPRTVGPTTTAPAQASTPATAGEDDEGQSTEPSGSFPRERWVTDSNRLLGVPGHVVVGALSGDDAEKMSYSQIRSRIQSFLSREVTSE